MGLLSRILTAPVAPVQAVIWLSEQFEEQADKELNDPAAIRAELAELSAAFDRGEIDEESFEDQEERLLRALSGLHNGHGEGRAMT